jgi:hypothetical protein
MDKSIFYNNEKLNKNKIKESWISKNFPVEYLEIKKLSTNLNVTKFSQLLYHYINLINHNLYCNFCNKENQNFIGFDTGYKPGCSRSCMIQLSRPKSIKTRNENTLEKYGVKHTSQLESVKNKQSKTNLEKYGSIAPAMNPLILEKMKNTTRKKYGVDFPLQSDIIKITSEQTCINKYGFKNYSQTEDWKKKVKVNGIYHIQSDLVKDKIKNTNYNKNLKLTKEKYEDNNYQLLSYNPYVLKFFCKKCSQDFEIQTFLAYLRKFRYNIDLCIIHNPLNNHQSNPEKEIIQFLYSNNITDIVQNNRKLLDNNFEIDIFLPKYKIGIEFNGVIWHSNKFKHKNYHFNKHKNSLSKDINLIHIWEDMWNSNQEIVKSILINKLNLSPNKIFARKCNIKLVNRKDSKQFLNDNHIQGWCISKFNYGLYYHDNLISLMTFGNNRINVGCRSNIDEYELLRYCNKIGYSIIGGASKLFNNFIKNINPTKIISYCDNDLFNGNLYLNLGFTYLDESIGYFYSNGLIRYNRWSFRKDKLIKIGFDKNKTADIIALEEGYMKCYNSGVSKFIWNKNPVSM